MKLTEARFRPHLTKRRFRKLAYGNRSSTGLLEMWSNTDLSEDPSGQWEMAVHVRHLLDDEETPTDSIYKTISTSFAREMKKGHIEYMCWRIAANIGLLKAGGVIPELTNYVGGHLVVPLQVIHAKYGWSVGKNRRPGTILSFQVIDGCYCPFKFSRWFPNKFLFKFATELGINGFRAKNRYKGVPTQLHGMRFVAEIHNSKYDANTLTFDRFVVGQFEAFNKKLMAYRAKPCPAGYNWPCHLCTLGDSDCPDEEENFSRACRPFTLTSKICGMCGETTSHDQGECIPCRRRPPAGYNPLGTVNVTS